MEKQLQDYPAGPTCQKGLNRKALYIVLSYLPKPAPSLDHILGDPGGGFKNIQLLHSCQGDYVSYHTLCVYEINDLILLRH